jgi:hypothetical protein
MLIINYAAIVMRRRGFDGLGSSNSKFFINDGDGFLGDGTSVRFGGCFEPGMQQGREVADEDIRHSRMIAFT